MELSAELKSKSVDELEEWFLGGLSADAPPVEYMQGVVAWLAADGQSDRASEWAELMQDALGERGMAREALDLLELRLTWEGDERTFATACAKAVGAAFSGRMEKALAAAVDVGGTVPPRECLRQLRVLVSLGEGVLCHDKTWGFGVVRKLDDFYQKVTIDFDHRQGHQMTFTYAAETLELVGDGHLYAVRYRDQDAFERMLREDSAEVVRIVLRSYGDVSAPRIKEVLVPDIMEEKDWKPFWDRARPVLKADPLVDLPTKRNDPIRLLSQAKEFGAAWARAFREERAIDVILAGLQELEAEKGVEGMTDEVRQALTDRLVFSMHGADEHHPEWRAQAALAAVRLGLDADDTARTEVNAAMEALLVPARLVPCLDRIPARDTRTLIDALGRHDAQKASASLVTCLPRLPSNVLAEAVDYLLAAGSEAACIEAFDEALNRGVGEVVMLHWCCRNLEQACAWKLTNQEDIFARCVEALCMDCCAHQLRAQNMIRDMFDRQEWVEGLLAPLETWQRQSTFRRVVNARGWDARTQRSVMAKMIRFDPDLERTAAESAGEKKTDTPSTRWTSWRSYGERQQQLKHLVEVTLPENSQEIAVARSYGDLRENFEYQAAKDRQRLLLRRKDEWEADLEAVKGTDFAGMPVDRAGMGTTVALRTDSGESLAYIILGEWDRDEALGIISNQSEVAKRLDGAIVGAKVVLGDDTTEQSCTVVSVSGLSDEVRNWARDKGAAGA